MSWLQVKVIEWTRREKFVSLYIHNQICNNHHLPLPSAAETQWKARRDPPALYWSPSFMLPGYNILTVSLMLLRPTQPEDWSVGLNWFALLLRRVAHGRKVTKTNTHCTPAVAQCMINYLYFLYMFIQGVTPSFIPMKFIVYSVLTQPHHYIY